MLYVDFGMKVIRKTETQRWYTGYGPDQYVYYAQSGPKKFLGGAFDVQSYEDLERYIYFLPSLARSISLLTSFVPNPQSTNTHLLPIEQRESPT